MVGVVDGGETDAGTNNAGGENCVGTGSVPAPTPASATQPAQSGSSVESCSSLIVDQNSWTGNMQGKIKISLEADISSYTVSFQTDIALTNIQFWEADFTPSSGNTFTVTSKSWFGGKKAGESLEL